MLNRPLPIASTINTVGGLFLIAKKRLSMILLAPPGAPAARAAAAGCRWTEGREQQAGDRRRKMKDQRPAATASGCGYGNSSNGGSAKTASAQR